MSLQTDYKSKAQFEPYFWFIALVHLNILQETYQSKSYDLGVANSATGQRIGRLNLTQHTRWK